MNYIKEAEQILYYYKDLHRSIINLDRRISKLVVKAGPQHLTSQAIDNVKVSGSTQHDETINLIFEIQTLIEEKQRTQKELDKIDCILDGLDDAPGCEHFAEILKLWYIKQLPREEIASRFNYMERNIYNIRAKAIRKFAVRMFGIEALKAV